MNTSSDLKSIRKDYNLGQLSFENAGNDPLALLHSWLQQAIDFPVAEPTVMTLATVNKDGVPEARIMLLKELAGGGLKFFTNYSSNKGNSLEANPTACLMFFWPELQKQVRATGLVTKLSEAESNDYFDSRPEGSRIGALASPQSQEIPNRQFLDDRVQEVKSSGNLSRPEHWGGYILTPSKMEFWQGRPSRVHDRILFKQENNEWNKVRLAP